MSTALGRRIDPGNVERLIDDALKTLEVFGSPGDETQQMLEGPFSDPATRREFQDRALQRTVRRATATPYYGRVVERLGIEPGSVTAGSVGRLPLTTKQDLLSNPRDFLAPGVHPYISTRTTGTTGHPVEIWLSRYEVELWPALGALSGLLRDEIRPSDCMQINISSRATAAVQQNLTVCRLVGARSRVLGVVHPQESLDSLLSGGEDAPTILATYPSYLAQLVNLARDRGLGPDAFRLRRIDCGGEILSAALLEAARSTLCRTRVNDGFGMTEVLPVSGRVCEQGHMHHDLNQGFIEVVDLQDGSPAAPEEMGSVVITPYYPYRECMPVLRYDTRDVVRTLSGAPLDCGLAGTPATSKILGKASGLLTVGDRLITTRDLVEVIEALPTEPWPARFDARESGDHLLLTMPRHALGGLSPADVERRFEAAGIPVRVNPDVVPDADAAGLRPLRADLVEATFTQRSA